MLDLDALEPDGQAVGRRRGRAADGALTAHRTGRMRDIVATIQAEQDRVIRSRAGRRARRAGRPGHRQDRRRPAPRGVPALHPPASGSRAAACSSSGRTRVFLRYIEQVLPVARRDRRRAARPPGSSIPGVDATAAETTRDGGASRATCGWRACSAAPCATAQRAPADPVHDRASTADLTVADPADVAAAPGAGPAAARKPHNEARRTFVRDAARRARRASSPSSSARDLDAEDRGGAARPSCASSPDVRRELNLRWMPLTPAAAARRPATPTPDRLAAAAPGSVARRERALLLREHRRAVDAVADVPLLDEAAELLGDRTRRPRRRRRPGAEARASAAEALEYAREVLEQSTGRRTRAWRSTAETLAERFAAGAAEPHARRARARADRTLGLRPRRRRRGAGAVADAVAAAHAPRARPRSMTVVGDVAQTGVARPAPPSWATMLDPYVEGRWRLEELTVNYRTPAEIDGRWRPRVLAAPGVAATAARSVRARRRVAPSERGPGGVARGVPGVAAEELADDRACSAAGGSPSSRPRRVADAWPGRWAAGGARRAGRAPIAGACDRRRGQGPRVRRRRRRRPAAHRRGLGARRERPLRGADPARRSG